MASRGPASGRLGPARPVRGQTDDAADNAADNAADDTADNAADDTADDTAGRWFDAVILAGGRAKRMGGADKPGLLVGDRTLAGAVVAAVSAAARVIVVGPHRRYLRGDGPPGTLLSVLEDPPGAGPVAALRRGIAEASAPRVALLAADLPFLRPDHLRTLLAAAAARQPPGAILVDDGGRPQWLAGCWHTGALLDALAAYRGHSLGGLLGPLRPVPVIAETAPGEPPPWLDCDSPADLRQAREWAARQRRSGGGR